MSGGCGGGPKLANDGDISEEADSSEQGRRNFN